MERNLEQLDGKAKARLWQPPLARRGRLPARGLAAAGGLIPLLFLGPPRFGLMTSHHHVRGQGAHPLSLSFLVSRIGTRPAFPGTQACCEQEDWLRKHRGSCRVRYTHQIYSVFPVCEIRRPKESKRKQDKIWEGKHYFSNLGQSRCRSSLSYLGPHIYRLAQL